MSAGQLFSMLEEAAKAAGYKIIGKAKDGLYIEEYEGIWNPVNNDATALQLAVRMRLNICMLNFAVKAKPHNSEAPDEWVTFHNPSDEEEVQAVVRWTIVNAVVKTLKY